MHVKTFLDRIRVAEAPNHDVISQDKLEELYTKIANGNMPGLIADFVDAGWIVKLDPVRAVLHENTVRDITQGICPVCKHEMDAFGCRFAPGVTAIKRDGDSFVAAHVYCMARAR